MNALQILKKYTLVADKFDPEDTFYRQSDVLKAMQEHAIDFGLYLENLEPINKVTVHPPDGSGSGTGLYYKTIEQLYNEYKK